MAFFPNNKKTDTYEFSGSMTAWDKGLREEDFPDEIDAYGDGLIYYLISPEWNEFCDIQFHKSAIT